MTFHEHILRASRFYDSDGFRVKRAGDIWRLAAADQEKVREKYQAAMRSPERYSEWQEENHPRDDSGQFGIGVGGGEDQEWTRNPWGIDDSTDMPIADRVAVHSENIMDHIYDVRNEGMTIQDAVKELSVDGERGQYVPEEMHDIYRFVQDKLGRFVSDMLKGDTDPNDWFFEIESKLDDMRLDYEYRDEDNDDDE